MSLKDRNRGVSFSGFPQSPDVAGTVVQFAGSVAPQGWMTCDGQVLEQADFPELYANIGGSWDAFDHPLDGMPTVGGSQFALPNFKGLYTNHVGSNGDQNYTFTEFSPDITAVNGLANASAALTSGTTGAATGAHTHQMGNSARAANTGSTFTVAAEESFTGQLSTKSAGAHSHAVTGTCPAQVLSGDAESRPNTGTLNYIIKLYSDSVNGVSVGVPQSRWQKRDLVGNESTSGVQPQPTLEYDNLIIGKRYKVTVVAYSQIPPGSGTRRTNLIVDHDGNEICRVLHRTDDNVGINEKIDSSNGMFTATATTVEVNTDLLGTGVALIGSGFTYTILEEMNDYDIETTDFTP